MMALLMGTFCFLLVEPIFLGCGDRIWELEPGDPGFGPGSAANRQCNFV